MSRKSKLYGILLSAAAAALTGAGSLCVGIKIAQAGMEPPINIVAAETAMPTGHAEYKEVSVFVPKDLPAVQDKQPQDSGSRETSAQGQAKAEPAGSSSEGFSANDPSKEDIAAYEKEHEGEERYPVHEFNVTEGNISYGAVQVKNTSSTEIDIREELDSALGFSLEKTDKPQVLIYHTHTSESYLPYDTGYFFESFFPRSTERSENVCAVGEEISKQLNSAGIVTIHDTTLHDYPSYSGAYYRSCDTVEEYLEKYPSIKVVLDIHRDGIGTDTEKYKPVFTADGRQGAQAMILAGYNYDGSEEFSDWEYNLRFALRLQKTAGELYPGMLRPLNFSDFMYNMNVNTGSLLIEVGGEANTINEARYTGYLLGKVIAETLKKEMNSGVSDKKG